jgi:hypothetical protein
MPSDEQMKLLPPINPLPSPAMLPKMLVVIQLPLLKPIMLGNLPDLITLRRMLLREQNRKVLTRIHKDMETLHLGERILYMLWEDNG